MSRSNIPVEGQIAKLDALSRDELVDYWIKLYGTDPFKGIRRQTLIRGIACKLQEKSLGTLRSSTGNRLLKIAIGSDARDAPRKAVNGEVGSRPKLQTGSKLIREWNGRTYEVIVADTGYVLNGITHRSLSACAKAITGAHWSGPRFFGARS